MKKQIPNQLGMMLYREQSKGKKKKVEKALRSNQFREETGKASDGRVQRGHSRQTEDELIERLAHLVYQQIVNNDETQDVGPPCRSIQETKGAAQGSE